VPCLDNVVVGRERVEKVIGALFNGQRKSDVAARRHHESPNVGWDTLLDEHLVLRVCRGSLQVVFATNSSAFGALDRVFALDESIVSARGAARKVVSRHDIYE